MAQSENATDIAAAAEPAPATSWRDMLRMLTGQAVGIAREVLAGNNDRSLAQRNAVVAFAVRVVSAALLYLTQIVLARWMGSFEYGIYVFVWTWVLVLGGLSSIGLNMVVIRLVPEYREQGKLALLRGLKVGTNLAAFLIGTALAVVGLAGLWLFEPYVANYYVLPLYLALVCIPIYALGDMQDGFGRAHAWMAAALIPPYVLRPLLVLGVMAGAYASGLPMEATTAAAAAVIATWLAALLQFALIQWNTSKVVPSGSRDYDWQLWLKTSLPLFVICACELALQNVDVLVVSTFLTPHDVGVYFAAAKTMSLIMFVHYAVGSAVANRFSALNARGDREGLERFVRDAVNWTFWPSLAAAAAILLLGQPLLWLFGPEFTSGYPVMIILVVGFLFRSAMGPSEFLLNMLGQQSACAVVLVFTAILNIVLNLLLVPWLGLVGAAIATSTSLAVTALLQYLVARQKLGLDIAIWSTWGKTT
ncbi:MAG: lipopolysaccharide biosynthesis protein [Filomicrobium sp.]